MSTKPRKGFSSKKDDILGGLGLNHSSPSDSNQHLGASSGDWNKSILGPYGLGSTLLQTSSQAGSSLSHENLPASDDWERADGNHMCMEETAMKALVTNTGIISVRLNNGVRVDITMDKAVRMLNYQCNIILAVGANGNSSALIHPSGSVYQNGSGIEITTPDPFGNTKYANMCYKGISFTSENCALVYVLDTAGLHTSTLVSSTFSDMSCDFSIPVFLSDANFGPKAVNQCFEILKRGQHWFTTDGTEYWKINGIEISLATDGFVRVHEETSAFKLRTSPGFGKAGITTSFVHATAGIAVPTSNSDGSAHLFVKKGEQRLHYDGKTFNVRYAGHSVGFDASNQLKVF